eukprot:4121205-Prymnesium_polylepis.1
MQLCEGRATIVEQGHIPLCMYATRRCALALDPIVHESSETLLSRLAHSQTASITCKRLAFTWTDNAMVVAHQILTEL